MKAIMCSIFDITTSTYRQPFYAMNYDDAKRAFKMIIGANELMKENPSDFELFELSSFDDQTGINVPGYLSISADLNIEPKRLFKGGEVYREV